MARIVVGDVGLHVEDTGRGAPVVLVHGLGTSGVIWREQLAAFGARYRTVTIDLRGFGASDRPRGAGAYAVETMAADVAAVIRTLGLGPVAYVGTSMGGYVGLALALAEPALVRALVLCHTAAHRSTPPAVLEARVTALRAGSMEDYGRLVATQALAPGADPALAARVAAIVAANDREAYVQVLTEGLAGYDVRDRLGTIDRPTLVVVGEHDRVVPPAEGRELARRIPGARLVELAGVGHLGYAERPEAFNAAVLEFFDALGGGGRART